MKPRSSAQEGFCVTLNSHGMFNVTRKVRAHAAAALAASVLTIAAAGCGSDRKRAAPAPTAAAVERLTAGRGQTGAWIFRRSDLRGKRLPAVLFVHGWGGIDPRTYRGWIDHLVLRGNAVIYPRYQDSVITPPATVFGNLVVGVRSALALPDAPVDASALVAVGHSAGGALAADYAASASALKLPVPRVVFAAYPGRAFGPDDPAAIPEIPGRTIPATTSILALAGEEDDIVGTRWARRIVATATRVPRERRRYRLVTVDAVDDHQAPAGSGRAARATFWRPFDELVAAARRRP